MRGQYTARDRRIFTSSWYKATIGVILAIAIALVALLLIFLPAVDEKPTVDRYIVSIENTTGDIGVGTNLNTKFVTVTYSDGTVENVALASMLHEGVNVNVAGEQMLSLSFGGFEQTIPIKVVNVDCVLQYNASTGGRVQGETTQYIKNGGDAATVVAIPETGYVFKHWQDGYPYASRKDYGVTETKTHLAIFEKAKFTVRFYYDNGTVASEEQVLYGASPRKVPNINDDLNMKKYGYTFVNWVPMDFSVIDKNLNIYPEYEKTATDVMVEVPHDQYGNAMGNTNARAEGFYEHNSLAVITAAPFNSREFSHWLIETSSGEYLRVDREGNATYNIGINNYGVNFASTKSGSNVADFQLSFTASAEILQVKIQAIFAYSETSITFINYQKQENNNIEWIIEGLPYGKSLSDYEDDKVSFRDGMPEPQSVIGMNFEGWFLETDSQQKIVDNTAKFLQPARLVAKWKKLQYQIIFQHTTEQGEKITWHTTTVVYQDTFASGTNGGLPAVNPTLENYIFAGWQDVLTNKAVDDKTKLFAEPEYIGKEDFENNRLIMVPIWVARQHTLSVSVQGSGSVKLIINEGKKDAEGMDLSEIVDDIKGIYTIQEINSYTLVFDADTGFEISSLRWIYANTERNDNFDINELGNIIIYVNNKYDNEVMVQFVPIKHKISITNGDGDTINNGLLNYKNTLYDNTNVEMTIEYNSTFQLGIESKNISFAITDIVISGKANGTEYSNYSLKSTLDNDLTSYTLILGNCLSDISVRIIYTAREYMVNIAPYNAEHGTIQQVNFFDLTSVSAVDSQTNYTYGDVVVYKITAQSTELARKYLSNLRINGNKIDTYTTALDAVRFFNWQTNNASLGIDAVFINGEYYYSYGSFEYSANNYIYCEGFYDSDSYIFSYSQNGGEIVYNKIESTANNYQHMLDFAKNSLNIAQRSIYNVQSVKDARVTTVYLMLTVKRDFNISLEFSDIVYNITVTAEHADFLLSSQTAVFKGATTVTVTPIIGYYIVGYKNNNGDIVEVETPKKGDSYNQIFGNITADINLEFVCQPITYKVSFANASAFVADIYVNGNLLNSTYEFELEYRSFAEFVIALDTADKRITNIYIDGQPQQLHTNMTLFTYVVNNIKQNILIEIECGDKTNDTSGVQPQYTVDMSNVYANNASFSVEYVVCDISVVNSLRVIAELGYNINSVVLSGRNESGDTKTLQFIPAENQKGLFDITIPADYFEKGTLSVSVSTTQHNYNIDITSTGNGSIPGVGNIIYHGEVVQITIFADANNHIVSFKINGDEIPFSNNQWSELAYNSEIKKYTYGTYSFVASEDVNIVAVFATNSYEVVLDRASVVGGSTSLILDGVGQVDKIAHGQNLSISMKANTGYHITKIFINGEEAKDYVPISQTVNANTVDTYIYKGKENNGITEKITVRVEYEINRYNFVYTLTNASENFAKDTNIGAVTATGLTLDGNMFKGIEHGSNFSMDILPSLTNGYYLYSVTVVYKSAYQESAETVVRLFTDAENIVSSRGGTIWFNRFMGFEEGVTADIELINFTFKRNLYTIGMTMSSALITGSMDISYSNRTDINSDVVLISAQGNKYYFRSDNKIYTKQGNEYILSDIALVFENGSYVYKNGSQDISLLIEHGIQYTVTVLPSEGYQRTLFEVNGEDRNNLVFENKYFVNLARDTVVNVHYTILNFNITYITSVIDKNLAGTISSQLIRNYMDIGIKNIGTSNTTNIAFGTDRITMNVNYGTILQFLAVAKFAETGYYLYSLSHNDIDQTNYFGDTKGTVTYGGIDGEGLKITQNITIKVSFRIMRYVVNTSISYQENIVNESANYVGEESGGAIPWGDNAFIKIAGGDGYELYEVLVKRGDNAYTSVVLNPDSSIIENLTEQMYYNTVNQNTNERRDALKVVNVKSDIKVVVYFVRKQYQLRYEINNMHNLTNIVTTLNQYNNVYPTSVTTTSNSQGVWLGTTNILDIKYYDEIATIITPNNGYKIEELIATVRAVRFDEDQNNWVAVLDAEGNEIIYTINYTETYNDSRHFTFHDANSSIARYSVKTDLMVTFTIKVKTYQIENKITRSDGQNNNVNDTEITMSVKDMQGENIILSDQSVQGAQVLKKDSVNKIYTAEHHGYITYVFDVANGFMLKSLNLNGLVWDNFRTSSLVTSYFEYSASAKTNIQGNIYYSYSIKIDVKDNLIAGDENFNGLYDIYVAIDIVPIEYQIKMSINNENYPYNNSTVTDNKTLSVNVVSSIMHFSTLSIDPSPLEGYKVESLSVMIGDSYGAIVNANFTIGDVSLRKSYSIISANLANSNVLEDRLTIYIYYQAVIKTYQVGITAYAYSSDTSLVGSGGIENAVALDTTAGKVAVTPTAIDGQVLPYIGLQNFEYFTNIHFEAYARENYSIYMVQEYVFVRKDSQGIDVYEWKGITNGVNGLSYSIVTNMDGSKTHIINYQVNDIGSRQFRVVYKQKTTVTVYLTNPYKYQSGAIAINSMTYRYYAEVMAKENGDLITSSVNYGNMVVKEVYVYNVYVGNRISLSYKDLFEVANQKGYSFRLRNIDGSLTIDNAVVTESGKLITGNLFYSLYTEVYGRVTFEKESNAANANADGGMVVFNDGVEPTNKSISSVATQMGKILKITVRPSQNFVFTEMQVRQMDRAKSALHGQVYFFTGASEWLTYDPSNFTDLDTNGFKITRNIDSNTGYIHFNIEMKGDMELRFVFYRTYEIEYTANFTDITAINKAINNVDLQYYNPNSGYADISYSHENENIASNNQPNVYKVSYGSSFQLSAPSTPENYVFVGWYVNGVNTFEYLDATLPGNAYVNSYFYVNVHDMSGLLKNNTEATKISFMAMYQPVLTVGLINELYYYNANDGHWNSWESGYIDADMFNFDGYAVPGGNTNNKIINTNYSTVGNVKTNYNNKLPNHSSYPNFDLFSGISNDKNIYSQLTVAELLYQNIKDLQFVSDEWVNSKIILNISALTSTVHFTSWQYYNWNTGKYEDISYTYTDANYGYESTCYYENYKFDLNYLYTGNMPYATSSVSSTNADHSLPLLIRPLLWKSVSVNLSKAAYSEYLGGPLTKNFDIISPTIDRHTILNSSELHTSTSDDGLVGEYDYGATIKLMYYTQLDTNGNVLDYTTGGVKYRFFGWFLNWNVNGVTDYRLIYDGNSMAGYNIDLRYAFGQEPPSDKMELRATYVTQFKQSLFSYNIAGGTTYMQANSAGSYAVKDAPSINVSLTTNTVGFSFHNFVTNQLSTVNKQEVKTDISLTSHIREFYIDVGANYTISLDATKKGDATSLLEVAQGGNMSRLGFDPAYDKQYKILKNNEDTNTPLQYNGEVKVVDGLYKLDIQYYTEAKLTFTNIMYYAGITVPTAIAQNLTNSADKMTVWDRDTQNYGDGNTNADGKVVMLIKLTTAGLNYHGRFDYAPNGYKDGYGIPAIKNLTYKYINSSGAEMECTDKLFEPSSPTYRRSIVIDYSQSYMANGSLLFGNPSVSGSNRYMVSNVGNGTAANPYKIYNAAQLQNLGIFFNHNDYSCKNVNNEQVHFRLFNNIQLQTNIATTASDKPYGNSKAWVPICYYYDTQTGKHKGFDGVLSGGEQNSYYTIEGLAADGIANLTPIDDVYNPLANFDYTNLQGYGIFGCVNGGTIENLGIGNAYIYMQSFHSAGASGTVSYVGILAARMYDSTINNIKFKEYNNIIRYNNTSVGTARVYLNAMTSVGLGMLAGMAHNTEISNVQIIADKADISIELLGGTTNNSGTGTIVGNITSELQPNGSILDNSLTITSGGVVLINYENGQKFTHTGGLFGSIIGTSTSKLDINNQKVELSGTSKLYIGNNSSINVGGVVGYLAGAKVSLLYTTVQSNGTVSTSNTSNIQAEYEPNSTTKSRGIFLTANTSGESTSMIGSTSQYGKAGAVVGLNVNASIINLENQYGIKGGFYFFAATAGGVVGVNSGGLVQSFAFFARNENASAIRLFFRKTTGVVSNYGGIAGANVNLGVVDNCSVINNEGTKDSPYNSLGSSYIYVFQKDSLIDVDYRSVQTHDLEIIAGKRKIVVPNTLTVGGIVAYNAAGVYNSFIKRSRVTVNYYNGAATDDYQWIVRAGGIVGYHDSGNDEGAFYGNDGPYFNELPESKFYIRRVQSCYTVGMSIIVLGHVWMEDNPNFPKQTLLVTATPAATIGGIVGATNNVEEGQAKVGQYAISNCYSLNNKYVLNFSAWGYTSNSGTEGDSKYGWYYHGGTAGIGKKLQVNRKGFEMDANIFGICSGYKLGEGGSYANYCWSQGNVAIRETRMGLDNGGFDDGGGWGWNPTYFSGRGIKYIMENLYKNTISYWAPGREYGNNNSLAIHKMMPGDGEVTVGTTTIDTSASGSHGAQPLYTGGFVGVVGGWDGRAYRTDYTTGLLMVWHDEADVGSAPSCVFGSSTDVYYGNASFNYYNAYYNNGSALNSQLLVRGQLTGTGNRLNKDKYGEFESNMSI